MGNKLVTFTEQQLENYQVRAQEDLANEFYNTILQDCTFFARKDILRYKPFWR